MLASTPSRAEDILGYWFGDTGEPRNELWFGGSPDVDADIRARFAGDLQRAAAGDYDDWANTPRGRLALVILLDQFSRNIYRDDPRAFAQDPRAQALAVEATDNGHAAALSPLEQSFLFMPLMHAEDLALQNRCCELTAELAATDATLAPVADFARRHRDVIARFGRFPHRNDVLGRDTTPEEAEHLATGQWF